jgi:hypothetical protein
VGAGCKRNKWGNLNSLRCEAGRHFRNDKKEYLRDKINDIKMNSKNKNITECYLSEE